MKILTNLMFGLTFILLAACSQDPQFSGRSASITEPKPASPSPNKPENDLGSPDGAPNPGDGSSDPTERLNFALIKAKILDAGTPGDCIHCHNSGKAKGGVNLETYQLVKSQTFAIQTEVFNDDMPIAEPLPDDLKQLLQDWIDAGAPEF